MRFLYATSEQWAWDAYGRVRRVSLGRFAYGPAQTVEWYPAQTVEWYPAQTVEWYQDIPGRWAERKS